MAKRCLYNTLEFLVLLFVVGIAFISISCKNAALDAVVELKPSSVYTPAKARVPYWFFSGSAGTYRYIVHKTDDAVDESAWTEFKAADATVYADLIDLLYDSDTWPSGAARVSSPARIYLFPPSTLVLTEGSSYSIKFEQLINDAWNEVAANIVVVDRTAPAAPVTTGDAESIASYKPSWSWTGPADAAQFLCTLSYYDATSAKYIDIGSSSLSSATAVDATSTTASFSPASNLPLDESFEYKLEVRSIDAAGNRSTAVDIAKLSVLTEADLTPVVTASGSFGTSSSGYPATTSHVPTWAWSLATLADHPASKYRYQLVAVGSDGSAPMNSTAWVTTLKSKTSFKAGTDLPDNGSASTAASLTEGSWKLYVEAYYDILYNGGISGDADGATESTAGWSNPGSLIIVVTGSLPGAPTITTTANTKVSAATSPWWNWAISDSSKVVSLGYSISYYHTGTYTSTDGTSASGLVLKTVTGTISDTTVTSLVPPESVLAEIESGNATLTLWTVDSEGNRSTSASCTVVADIDAPTVVSIERSAASSSSYYPLKPSLKLSFSEAMSATNLASAISLVNTSDTSTPITAFTLTATDTTKEAFTLALTSDLAPNASYTLTVGTGATDIAGNALSAAGSLGFTTGTPIASFNTSGTPTKWSSIGTYVTDSNLQSAMLASAVSIYNSSGQSPVFLQDITTIDYDETETYAATHTNDTYNVADLTGIELCTSLTQLTLVSNSVPAKDSKATTITTPLAITNTAKLASCTKLQKLVFKGYAASSLSFLSSLSKLFYLDLSFDHVGDTNLASLGGLTGLTTLILADNSLTTCTSLKALTSILLLDISDNSVTDSGFADLSALTKLTTLVAPRNLLASTSTSKIESLAALKSLSLDGNSLTALPDFSKLAKLIAARFKAQKNGGGTLTLASAATLANVSFDNTDNATSTTEPYWSSLIRYLDLSSNGITSVAGTYSGTVTADSLAKLNCSYNAAMTSLSLASYPGLVNIDVSGCSTLASVTLAGCTALTAVDLTDSYTSTSGTGLFAYRTASTDAVALSKVASLSIDGSTSLASVKLSGCTALTTLALKNCTALTSIASTSLPSTVTSVDLTGCTGLTSISSSSFPTTITSLNLTGCTGLTSVDLSSFTSLASVTLTGCTGLASVNLTGCTSLASVVLSSLTGLASATLNGCTGLTSVSMTGCTSLASVSMTGCTSLASVSMTGCTSLASVSMTGCTSLASIPASTLPSSIKTINLTNCTGLADVLGLHTLTSATSINLTGCTNSGLTATKLTALETALGSSGATIVTRPDGT